MDYNKLYNNLICSRKALNRQKNSETYYETHHIKPKCLGGHNTKDNLVVLTAREHFIAHKLLTKIYPNNVKLLWAYSGMCGNRQGRNLKSYEVEDCKVVAGKLLQEISYDENGYHRNSKVGKFTQEQKQEILSIFKGTILEKELIGEMYGVHWSTIIKILKEQGLTGKEIKTISCVKREYRHKLQLLVNGTKRKGNNKGISRNNEALERQRESIKEYWKNVREGKIERVEKFSTARPTIIIETGEIMKSRNILRKDYFVQPISRKLISRKDPNIVYHWKYLDE